MSRIHRELGGLEGFNSGGSESGVKRSRACHEKGHNVYIGGQKGIFI